jgi:hypothetical protein
MVECGMILDLPSKLMVLPVVSFQEAGTCLEQPSYHAWHPP